MRRATIILLAAVMAFGFSSMLRAEILISQNFDSDVWTVGYKFSSLSSFKGDPSTTDGGWRVAPGSSLDTGVYAPIVTSTYSLSPSKSIEMRRPSWSGVRFQGYTDLAGDGVNSGILEGSYWYNRSASPLGTNYATLGNATTWTASAPRIYLNSTGAVSALVWDSSLTTPAWVGYVIPDVTTPTDAWFGLKMVVDLDAKQYDVWYNPGTDWTEVASDLAMENKDYFINSITFNPNTPATDGRVRIDDVLLQTIPEPGTLALLAGGLVGLLAYAWRKRR